MVLTTVQRCTSVKDLRVWFSSPKVLPYLTNFKELKRLRIEGDEWHLAFNQPYPLYELQELLLHLRHYPKLTTLELCGEMSVVNKAQALRPHHQTTKDCEPGIFGLNIKLLFLHKTNISDENLRTLLDHIGNLETFVCDTLHKLNLSKFGSGQLAYALTPIEASVQNLYLDAGSADRYERYVRRLINNFSAFQSLRRLAVCPSILYDKDATHRKKGGPYPSLFQGNMLPDSLQELTLITGYISSTPFIPMVEAYIEQNVKGDPCLGRLRLIWLSEPQDSIQYRRCAYDANGRMKCVGSHAWLKQSRWYGFGPRSPRFGEPLTQDKVEEMPGAVGMAYDHNEWKFVPAGRNVFYTKHTVAWCRYPRRNAMFGDEGLVPEGRGQHQWLELAASQDRPRTI